MALLRRVAWSPALSAYLALCSFAHACRDQLDGGTARFRHCRIHVLLDETTGSLRSSQLLCRDAGYVLRRVFSAYFCRAFASVECNGLVTADFLFDRGGFQNKARSLVAAWDACGGHAGVGWVHAVRLLHRSHCWTLRCIASDR